MKIRRRHFSPFMIGLIGSVCLHLLTILRLNPSEDYASHSIPPELSTIDLMDLPKSTPNESATEKERHPKKRDFIEHAQTEKLDNNEIDPEAKFLGEKNQKAENQSRAQNEADFKEGNGKGGPKSEPEEGPSEWGDKTVLKKDWHELSLKDLSMGGDTGSAGATNDYLDKINKSDRTVLSTREDKFFSYFYRIKQVLSQKWRGQLDYQMARLYRKGRAISQDQVVTSLLILLDEEGNIKRISKKESSGYEELDEAAVGAFQLAGPFPNPPRGIIDPDGFVRIDWNFILNVENGPRIQFRTVGNAPVY